MFTSVLGALTSALPKYLLWGAYVPVLIFSFLNGGLVYVLSAPGHAWLKNAVSTNSPLTVGTAFVFTIAAAYVLSSVNDLLREILEGRYVLNHIPLISPYLVGQQQHKRLALQNEYLKCLARRYDLSYAKDKWESTLAAAAEAGATNVARPLDDQRLYEKEAVENRARDEVSRKAEATVRELRRLTRDPFTIAPAQISTAVDAMSAALRTHNKIADAALARDHKALLLLIETIYNTTLEREWSAALELNMSFSGDVPQTTQMGNIADALFGYAMRRYGIDLNVLMSRLQTTLLKADDKSYAMMLDAKTQLDFIIACCFLICVTTIAWAVILTRFSGPPPAYLAVAAGGSLLTWLFFALATQCYRSYSIAVRACVDVNRFGLLRALDLPLPTTLNGELRLWRTVSEAAIAGSTIELSYEHASKTT